LIDVDLSIGIKQTPRQDAKSNAAQDDEQHNAALRRQNHKKHNKKNLIYVKIIYLNRKKSENHKSFIYFLYMDENVFKI